MTREFPITTHLTAAEVTALEARRIYGGDADRQGQRCEAVTHGTGTRGRVRE